MTPTPHRSLEFLTECRDVSLEINAAVTMILADGGRTTKIPEGELSPVIETAAMILAGYVLGVTGGNVEAARDVVWPMLSAQNVSVFEGLVQFGISREEASNG